MAQGSEGGNPQPINVIPPSPTASSLGQYADFPITMYTGVPNISIPLYELKSYNLSLPISLSYHASGHKVEDVPSWVGLGWSLNAGGVITRSVRGMKDEDPLGGYFYANDYMPEPSEFDINNNDTHYQWLEDIAYGKKELVPDLFMFNFNGYSGKFYFDREDEIHLVSHQDIKILAPPVKNLGSADNEWTIITPDGVEYRFGGANATEVTTSLAPYEGGETSFTSSWYLTRITAPSGDYFNFSYQPTEMTYKMMLSETDYIGTPQISTTTSQSIQSVFGFELSEISNQHTIVTFVTDEADREDLFLGGKKLNEIIVKSQAGLTLKRFEFNTGYSNSSGGASEPYLKKRLILNAVSEYGTDGDNEPKEYRFYYRAGGQWDLPARDSKAQDHWGFYNGETSNSTLLPAYEGMPAGITYGNREPSRNHMLANSLYRIVYPTKGYTQFNMEPNQYEVMEEYDYNPISLNAELLNATQDGIYTSAPFNINVVQDIQLNMSIDFNGAQEQTGASIEVFDNNNNLIFRNITPGINQVASIQLLQGTYYLKLLNTDIAGTDITTSFTYVTEEYNPHLETHYVGGLRVKSIEHNDGRGDTPPIITHYQYGNHKIFTDINNGSYLSDYAKFDANGDCGEGSYDYDHYKIRSSSSKSVLGSIQGSPIGYGTVKVLKDESGTQGYSIYKYSLDSDIGGGAFPYPPVLSREHRRGLLLLQEDYDASETLLKRQVNTYDIKPMHLMTGLAAGFLQDNYCYSGAPSGRNWDQIFSMSFYSAISEWVKATESKIVEYSTEGDSIIQTTTNYYHSDPIANHAMIKGQKIFTSDGRKISSDYKYVADYSGSDAAINELKNTYNISPILETTKWMSEGLDSVLISAEKTIYNDFSGDILPQHIYTFESATPVPSASFFSNPENYFKLKLTYDSYDFQVYSSYGRVRQYTILDQYPITFIWGDDFRFPVLKIENADYYTVITALGSDLQFLKSSYGSLDQIISTRSQIDNAIENLNVQLPQAMVSSYLYDQTLGIIRAQIDPNGMMNTYEYDHKNRLIRIRDNDQNIIQTTNYHYRENE